MAGKIECWRAERVIDHPRVGQFSRHLDRSRSQQRITQNGKRETHNAPTGEMNRTEESATLHC